jgi:ribosomal protein S6--L-glutamate ligase
MIAVIGEKTWMGVEDSARVCVPDIDKVFLRLSAGKLMLYSPKDFDDWVIVSSVIWRLQFDTNKAREIEALQIIEASGVPCVNSAQVCLRHGPRLSGCEFIKRLGIPIVKQEWILDASMLAILKPEFPTVLKISDEQMGYGKLLINNEYEWSEIADYSHGFRKFICIEEFMPYEKDIRLTVVGNEIIACERKSENWKANVNPTWMDIVDAPEEIVDMSKTVQNAVGCSVAGYDWIFTERGDWKLLEMNLSPGLNISEEHPGMENKLQTEVVRLLKKQV